MKGITNRIFKIFWSRLGRNIIFWILLIWFWLHDKTTPSDYPLKWYVLFRTIMISIMIILAYFNNLVLVPNLLARRKYWWYIISGSAYAYVMALCLSATFITMMHYFPKMGIWDVSFATYPIEPKYTFIGMINGAGNYFPIMLLWVCFFDMAWYANDYARQQKVIEESKKKQVETELTFLKGQINPHFLFNNLNNLYGLALRKAENTPEAILKLSSILRYLLYESDVETVSFEKEKEVMNAYIDLELLRLSDVDHLHFAIVSDGDYNIPPLLWMPVLENVFKHATRVITDNYYVEYQFEIKNNLLTIYSKNNYKPNGNGEIKEKNGGIGLENLRKRLSLLYPGKHTIETSHDDLFYTTEVKINLA